MWWRTGVLRELTAPAMALRDDAKLMVAQRQRDGDQTS